MRAAELQGLDWINSPEKRAMDISMAIVAFPILVPIGSVALGLSRLVDGKDSIFHQVRFGQNGKQVSIKKIRTLHADTDPNAAGTGPVNDNATKLGQILRIFAIDEIPQITNIFNGSMSVVGPRVLNHGFLDAMQETLPRNGYDEWLET